jgi:hypothetical protein
MKRTIFPIILTLSFNILNAQVGMESTIVWQKES